LIPADVGVAYSEHFAGTLLGQDFELALDLEIGGLPGFLSGPHLARVVGGFVRVGHAAPVRVSGGTAELFHPCRDGAEFTVEFSYSDAEGRAIIGRGLRTLGPAQRRDPAAELSELALALTINGTPLASGTLRSSIEQTLERLVSVRPLRAEGAVAREVRDAFLEFFNQRCSGVHPELPFLVDTGISLPVAERRALTLAATVMLPERFPADGPSVCQAIQQLSTFLAHSDHNALADLRAQLGTLGQAAPFLNGLIAEIRSFVRDILESEKPSPFRPILDSIHKVSVLGYYSHPAADALVGYQRPTFVPLYHTRLPVREHPTPRVFDVAIVGAGVAGSLLAERLTAQNKSVLLIEQGPYVAESDLTSDEALWIARLQKNSGLQRANLDGPLADSVGNVVVLQGACVGGGGMINNAVCFMLPDRRLEQWRGLGFPVEPSDLRQSFLAVARELDIGPISEKTAYPNPVCRLLENSFGKARVPKVGIPLAPGFYECLVNLAPRRCLGCGMCNTGCGSERKRNALQVHLPRALAPGRDAELLADTEVAEILVGKKAGPGALQVEGLSVRTRRGTLRVKAREYVLSAGAVGTNALMLRSPGFRYATQALPIGKRFSANVVSPVVSFYDDLVINPRPTLQLTHYYVPPGADDGFLLESMNDPPGQMALLMPGYGERHHQRMLKYKSTGLMGIAIGTLPNGEVTLDESGRAKITMPLGENEHRRMKSAFDVLLRALFRGGAGKAPVEVVAGLLGGGYSMRSEADVDGFGSWFKSISRVILSTGHPMGGSAMSSDARLSVVGPDFRVRGFSNLRVCDASLFPMAAGVNPQWTVLALADRCSHVMNSGG
jgi:choline dehydrogenase-like flavoprotein